MLAEREHLGERGVELVLPPCAEIRREETRARHGVQALAGLDPGHLKRQLRMRLVQRRDPQGFARQRDRGISAVSRRLSRVRCAALAHGSGTSGRLSARRRPVRSAGRIRGRGRRPCRADARPSAGRRHEIPRRARTRPRSGRRDVTRPQAAEPCVTRRRRLPSYPRRPVRSSAPRRSRTGARQRCRAETPCRGGQGERPAPCPTLAASHGAPALPSSRSARARARSARPSARALGRARRAPRDRLRACPRRPRSRGPRARGRARRRPDARHAPPRRSRSRAAALGKPRSARRTSCRTRRVSRRPPDPPSARPGRHSRPSRR